MKSSKILMRLTSDQKLFLARTSRAKTSYHEPIRSTATYSSTPSITSSSLNNDSANSDLFKTSPRPKSSKKLSDQRALGVGSLISRSPLILPKLTKFESAYYKYQNYLHQTLSKPIDSSFFFRPGSIAATNFEKSRNKSNRVGFDEEEGLRREKISNNLRDDLKSLERLPDRTLYLLLLKKSNKFWELPHSKISDTEDSLLNAAVKTAHLELGPHLDIWSISRFPAAVYQPTESKEESSGFKSIWIMPQRILRGQVNLSLNKSLNETIEFGWLSDQEIKERVSERLWITLEPILNP